VARFEEEDAGCVFDGGEADPLESGVHETCVFEAVASLRRRKLTHRKRLLKKPRASCGRCEHFCLSDSAFQLSS
jgi:hypothetical protein